MAAPNLQSPSTINGKSVLQAVTASMVTLINNAAASGKLLKVDSLVISNVDGTNAADITVKVFNQDDIGGTGFAIVSTVSVPADTSLVVITKDNPIYLEEDESIGVQASAAGDLEAVASYLDVS